MNNWLPRIGLFAGPLVFFCIIYLVDAEGLKPEANLMLALTAWMAIWWITEALPIAGTALLPLVVLPLAGVLPIVDIASNYMDPTVMLYMGGFLLAILTCVELCLDLS